LPESYGNTISALKNGQSLQGFDIYSQILDESEWVYDTVTGRYIDPSPGEYTGNNNINGYDKCVNHSQDFIESMMAMDEAFVLRQKNRFEENGGF